MHGVTSSYAVDPVGEYVVGVLLAGDMEVRKGAERHVFHAGDLCLWDPSARHVGRPHRGEAWEARLIVLELPAVEDLVLDPEQPYAEVAFPAPRVRDGALAERFLRLHVATEGRSSALERESLLLEWFSDLVGRPSSRRESARAARRDPALLRACELLVDDPTANIGLGQLAAAAGVSRHRLTRLFRVAYGLPPHRFQIAQRVRLARRLLEEGVAVADAARRAGFFDQSHLHRHFQQTLGLTPRRYADLLRSNVQDRRVASP
jgi:AraC-like DNA-binding protein